MGNTVLAKSRFWYFMKKINKAKQSGGELLAVNELFDRGPTKVKNYGIWLRYESRTNTHNMYKEFRDVNINGAVSKLYQEMAGRHRAQPGSIQIINTAVLKPSECRRDHVTEMHDAKLKFPVVRKVPVCSKKLRTTFKARGLARSCSELLACRMQQNMLLTKHYLRRGRDSKK